jgi:predicted phosphodiesterase
MKLAVCSDIHGNTPALAAVIDDIRSWAPDQVIVNGDLVGRGPYSLACMRMIRECFPDARYTQGNHETYVLRCADTPPDPASPTRDINRFADWTVSQLGDAINEIRAWHDHIDITGLAGGASAHITHGSRLGNRDGISARTEDADLPEKLGDPRDLFVGSHTHKPLLRRFNGTLVVNTGSVGQPMDGDPRSAYGRFTLAGGDWHAEIVRVGYDKSRAEQDFIDSGFLDEAGPMARLIFLELQQSRSHVGPWHRQYLDVIKSGVMTVAEAVEEYLDRQQ